MARTVLLVMGVSGAGKTTLGRALAKRLDWTFLDADDLHPAANVAKMSAGIPLTDADRAPWLVAVGRWIDDRAAENHAGVIACSALKRRYRDVLREGRPQVRIVYVAITEALAEARVGGRTDHYMPASLVPSQFAALEPPGADEPTITVDAALSTEAQTAAVLAAL